MKKKKLKKSIKTFRGVMYIPEFLRHLYDENGVRILGKS